MANYTRDSFCKYCGRRIGLLPGISVWEHTDDRAVECKPTTHATPVGAMEYDQMLAELTVATDPAEEAELEAVSLES